MNLKTHYNINHENKKANEIVKKPLLKASIILSNYNGIAFLKNCLSHLVAQTYGNYEIVFIDAGSTDGSADFVEGNFPEIKTIRCGRIGIGEAINIGIGASSGEIIVFDVNTDEYVVSTWLEELVKHLKQHDYNIVSGPVRLIYGTELIDEAGVNIDIWGRAKKLGHMIPIDTFKFIDESVDYVGAPAFHKKVLEKIGMIDEDYFIYAEDLDFCYRAKKAGYQTYVAPMARSYHHIRGTLGRNHKRLEYYLRRANIRYQILHSPICKLIPALLYFTLFLPLTALILTLIPNERSKIYRQKFSGRMKAIKWNIENLKKKLQPKPRVTY